ncbi:MAG: dephospho-CoA kinase [Eubacteriales bacterium]|nr:dephospho-CoA kinase [Eubacteriales bacterium]
MKRNSGGKMIILGITGAVGAGKSTIMNRLREQYGAYTIQADQVGHLLMKKGQICYDAILKQFGEGILAENGEIDRKKLGGIVFSNRRLLLKLNNIIHPAVKQYILDMVKKKRQEGCALFAMEAALLLEEHYDAICDDLWYIYVNDEVRRARLKADRGYSDEKITEILENQLEDGIFRERCRYVVENNGDLNQTYEQIDKRINMYGIM